MLLPAADLERWAGGQETEKLSHIQHQFLHIRNVHHKVISIAGQ
jgi:hypothetical protein